MCISCLLFSTLTLFIPAPQPGQTVVAGVPQIAYNQAEPEITAENTQKAIAALLAQLPTDPEMLVLRQELAALHTQLAAVPQDTNVSSLLNFELRNISQRVLSEPSADRAIEVLNTMMLVEDNGTVTKTLEVKMLQFMQKHSPLLNHKTGWIK